MSEYRVRWAIVSDQHGNKSRKCIAERKVRFLGLVDFYWPVEGWRQIEEAAMGDIEDHKALMEPLPKTTYV